MEKKEYTITVYTENQIGLLNRIAIIFSRRKINIDSMNTSPSEIEGIHRFTILIDETEEVVRKVCRQIEKQVEVLKAYYNTEEEIVWQEMALYKVSTLQSSKYIFCPLRRSHIKVCIHFESGDHRTLNFGGLSPFSPTIISPQP